MENPNLDIHDCDWELVAPNSDEHLPLHHHSSSAADGGVDGGVICSDYFSIDDSAATTVAAAATLVGGDSDFNSDSGDRNLLGLIPPNSNCGVELGFDHSDNSRKSLEIVQNNSVSGDDQVVSGLNFEDEDETKTEENENENENEDENEKKMVVWWKVPVEVLKYWVWRVSPVWSISMVAAAAVMGFVILRRRYLYKMKRKSHGVQLNVSVDDNKVSQLMSRAARLNEAFSVVKQIPVIRPALPAPGMTSWPVMSLR